MQTQSNQKCYHHKQHCTFHLLVYVEVDAENSAAGAADCGDKNSVHGAADYDDKSSAVGAAACTEVELDTFEIQVQIVYNILK